MFAALAAFVWGWSAVVKLPVIGSACHEGWRYHHVQAIIVSIDQYAESALGNREYFLNRPYGIGGSRKDNLP
jgi:hypothetical protein